MELRKLLSLAAGLKEATVTQGKPEVYVRLASQQASGPGFCPGPFTTGAVSDV